MLLDHLRLYDKIANAKNTSNAFTEEEEIEIKEKFI